MFSSDSRWQTNIFRSRFERVGGQIRCFPSCNVKCFVLKNWHSTMKEPQFTRSTHTDDGEISRTCSIAIGLDSNIVRSMIITGKDVCRRWFLCSLTDVHGENCHVFVTIYSGKSFWMIGSLPSIMTELHQLANYLYDFLLSFLLCDRTVNRRK